MMNVVSTAGMDEYILLQLKAKHDRIEASRKCVKNRQLILADPDYFEKKREIIREKYFQEKTSS